MELFRPFKNCRLWFEIAIFPLKIRKNAVYGFKTILLTPLNGQPFLLHKVKYKK